MHHEPMYPLLSLGACSDLVGEVVKVIRNDSQTFVSHPDLGMPGLRHDAFSQRRELEHSWPGKFNEVS